MSVLVDILNLVLAFLLIYSSVLTWILTIIFGQYLAGHPTKPTSQQQFFVFVAGYGPWFAVPASMMVDMFGRVRRAMHQGGAKAFKVE